MSVKSLAQFNALSRDEAEAALLTICHATAWIEAMLEKRPFADHSTLLAVASEAWALTREPDWLEAFKGHAKIGDEQAFEGREAQAAEREQGQVRSSSIKVLSELARLNSLYEDRFGFIFIICAMGERPEAMLAVLKEAVESDRSSELNRAAAEQLKIMIKRLADWQ